MGRMRTYSRVTVNTEKEAISAENDPDTLSLSGQKVRLHLLVESASGLIYVKRNAFKRNLCTFVSDYHHQAVDP